MIYWIPLSLYKLLGSIKRGIISLTFFFFVYKASFNPNWLRRIYWLCD